MIWILSSCFASNGNQGALIFEFKILNSKASKDFYGEIEDDADFVKIFSLASALMALTKCKVYFELITEYTFVAVET